MKPLYLVPLLGVWVLVAGGAFAATKPLTEACTVLPVAQVGKVFGTRFHVTTRNGQIAPLGHNTAVGSQCSYESGKQVLRGPGGTLGIWFVVYVESSATVSRDVFKNWRAFIDRDPRGPGRTTTVAGVGDAAFRDPNHVLYVRTGKAYFNMGFNPVAYKPPKDQQERQRDLAQWVVRHL